jgi:hypothetical protein
MSSARTALRERVAALGRARRAFGAGRLDDAERVLQDELARWPGNRDAQALLAEITRARGETPGHAGAASTPAPKAGGEAWSSFEQRIRDRKAARLQDRIRSSLAAESPAAVLESLEELDSIAPHLALPDDIVEGLRARHLERPASQERPRPSSPSPTAATASPLDLFPKATIEPEPQVPHAPPAFEELPLRPREPTPLDAALDPATAPVRDDAPMRLRLAPTTESRAEPSVPLRERGTHLLGLLLLVSSILALSGWAGYELFTPTDAVTDAATTVADSTTDAPEAAPANPTPTPLVSDARENSPAVDAGTTGTAGAGTGASSAKEPIELPGTPAEVAADPPVPATTPATDRTADARQSVTREAPTASAARERTPSPPPAGSVSTEARLPAEPAAPLPSVSGGTPAPSPPVQAAQPTPAQPTAPIAENRTEPATPVSPSSPAPNRDSGGGDSAVASDTASAASDAGTGATAEAGTSARDADAMRGLIEGYLAGYNNLDAGGVRAVWPAVDQRALARAFGQLRSQHLSFSRCEVRTTGGAGHGFCTGHAAWRPRVGGGERIEQRVWRFDFAQRDDDWIIQKVNVER